ncbi:type III pantothenate kinase [Salinimonas sediminis]|uniref:Type III pantothenate kinase n=1 Tax=Salinimonas sediminis TaxID=2303538 RepID=A0A346NQM1_9ALTE|nr:type III pantothenate kinase [Salinimonas sediminis]AXR07828.1 type III pantothenate kinase [Salinimonas sediminis]
MVTENAVLLVDAGNTRIKYITLDSVNDTVWTADNPEHLFAQLTNHKNIRHIYLSNVGPPDFEQQFSTFCLANAIDLRIIHTEREQFGLVNSYSDESKMGCDRWLAMIAAHKMTSKRFAVIDIGTAITCDFVEDGQHLGGWIIPGYALMKDALVKNTARVVADNKIPAEFSVGQSTQDCVAMGCQAAVRGVYLSAVDYLSNNKADFSIIIGGGGKNMLAFAQFDGSILVANLVVHGLARYARSEIQALVSNR